MRPALVRRKTFILQCFIKLKNLLILSFFPSVYFICMHRGDPPLKKVEKRSRWQRRNKNRTKVLGLAGLATRRPCHEIREKTAIQCIVSIKGEVGCNVPALQGPKVSANVLYYFDLHLGVSSRRLPLQRGFGLPSPPQGKKWDIRTFGEGHRADWYDTRTIQE